MSHCATFTLPSGTVGVVRPNPALVAALLRDTREDAIAATDRHFPASFGPVVGALWDTMTARTEEEAVRVIAERDAPRVAIAHGFAPADVASLGVTPETGLLDASPDGRAARRRFRSCWRKVGAAVTVDMVLARAQRMTEVRTERNAKLAASDIESLRAQETGDAARSASLKVYRQALRDLPATAQPTVEGIATPEALAAWEPAWPTVP